MIQLYLLSIIFNGLIGFLLILGDTEEVVAQVKGIRFFFSSWGFRLVLGIITLITGILKLLLPMPNSERTAIPILGDLLPALGGIVAGFILIFSFYRENSTKNESANGKLDRIGDTLLQYRKAVGISLLVISVLHFLFPAGLFL